MTSHAWPVGGLRLPTIAVVVLPSGRTTRNSHRSVASGAGAWTVAMPSSSNTTTSPNGCPRSGHHSIAAAPA
jgi:hypothetical protein